MLMKEIGNYKGVYSFSFLMKKKRDARSHFMLSDSHLTLLSPDIF